MKNLTFLFTLLSVSAFSQTRLISHKSHSGSMATFNTALENSLFDIAASNFGAPGSEMRFVVDSVILLPDNRAVIISSEKDVWVTYPKSSVILTGRDTLYNAMLSNRHNKDSLFRVLSQEGSYKPVLINYDNEKPAPEPNREKKNTIVAPSGNDNFPNKPMLVAALALLSGVLAFISYFFYTVKNAQATT
ncbi:MAG: hypothetical protein V4581_04395 [Bacteroidota bacterium]